MPIDGGLSSIIGQVAVVERLRAILKLYASNKEACEHVLLAGADGMGKRTIALAFAREIGAQVKTVSARTIERKGDLTAVLTALEKGELLILEEINLLKAPIRDVLCMALEEFRIDLIIGKNISSRVHPFALNRFTCFATVPREPDCPPSLRNAFSLVCSLQQYKTKELGQIALRLAAKAGMNVTPEIADLMGRGCNGTPHHLEILVRRLAKAGTGVSSSAGIADALAAYGFEGATKTGPLPKTLQTLSGVEFEQAIATLLRRMGLRAEVTKASGDGGIDIIAVWDKPILGGRYLIQCKRFAENTVVGAAVVREFYGAMIADRKASKGIFITTSTFSGQAREFALGLPLELVDGQQLQRLLLEYSD
jgi:DNA polymerase III delta prime subunit